MTVLDDSPRYQRQWLCYRCGAEINDYGLARHVRSKRCDDRAEAYRMGYEKALQRMGTRLDVLKAVGSDHQEREDA